MQKVLAFVMSKEMINSIRGVVALEGVCDKREYTGKCNDRGNLLALKLGGGSTSGQFSKALQGHISFHIHRNVYLTKTKGTLIVTNPNGQTGGLCLAAPSSVAASAGASSLMMWLKIEEDFEIWLLSSTCFSNPRP